MSYNINGVKYMSIEEYAINKGVTTKTVYQWIKDCKIEVKEVMKTKLIKL